MNLWKIVISLVTVLIFDAASAIAKFLRPHVLRSVWQTDYWHFESPTWNHYYRRVEYSNGDIIWISNQTGKVCAGITYDGIIWDSYASNLEFPK